MDGLRIFINDGVIDSIQITNEKDLERLKQMLNLEIISFDSEYDDKNCFIAIPHEFLVEAILPQADVIPFFANNSENSFLVTHPY